MGGRQRDGVPGERLLVVPDRRGRQCQQPARLSTRQPQPARAAARDRRAAVRRAGREEHDRPRHRGGRRHPHGHPLPPLRLQGVDGGGDPLDLPGRAVRHSRRRSWPAHDARAKLERAVRASFEAIEQHGRRGGDLPERGRLPPQFERFAFIADRNTQFRQVWVTLLEEGVRTGALRNDLDVELAYRFLRDTVWVAVRGPRPGPRPHPHRGRRPVPPHPPRRDLTPAPSVEEAKPSVEEVAQATVNETPASRKRAPSESAPTSSTPSAHRSASAGGSLARCTPPTSAPTRWRP